MRQLHENHLADLRRSGISDESIEACGLYSASAETAGALTGMNVGSGLVFPFPGTADEAGRKLERVKLDEPLACKDGKTMKYASPTKATYPIGNRLYLCALLEPEVVADPSVEIFITEGEKKAIKACQEGFPTVGLSGVWNWKARDEQGRSATIADLDLIDFRGRSVGIVFDSDAVQNSQVMNAERALFSELAVRGAVPFVVRLPSPNRQEKGKWGKKFGLDDLMVARGAAEFHFLVEWSRNPLPLGCRSVTVLDAQPVRERPWLVEGIWKVGDCGFFAGAPKTKKSLLALDLAIAVASGQPFLGRSVTQGRVIIVDEETNYQEFRLRLEQLAHGRGLALADLEDINFIEKGRLRLDDPAKIEELKALCSLTEPTLLILDPFVRMHEKDEDKSQDVSPMLGRLRRVSEAFDTSIIIVHHFKKNSNGKVADRMRGSGDMYGWLDAAVFFDVSDDRVQLDFAYRYGVPEPQMFVRLPSVQDGLCWEVIGDSTLPGSPNPTVTDDERLLQILADGPMKKSDIRGITGRSGGEVSGRIDSLERRGLVVVEKAESTGGRPPEMVSLTSSGWDFLSDGLSAPKERQEVLKSESLDAVSSGPERAAGSDDGGSAFSDSASALAGSRFVEKARADRPPAPANEAGKKAAQAQGDFEGDIEGVQS